MRSILGSSPRGTRIIYANVKSILHACLLGSLTDGIILDPPILCTFRFELNEEHAMQEVMYKGATTHP